MSNPRLPSVPVWCRDPLVRIANTPTVLLVTLIGTLVLSGTAYAFIEADGFSSMDDGLYWAVTTMSTTGYGDLSPKTGAGRILGGALMLWSIFFLLPAAIYHVAERLIHDKDEWSHDEQVQLRRDLHDIKTTLAHLASAESASK